MMLLTSKRPTQPIAPRPAPASAVRDRHPGSGRQVPRGIGSGRSTSGQTGRPAPTRRSTPPLTPRSRHSSLKPLPSAMPMPAWLQFLKKTEQVSLMITSLLVTGAVFTYGWSMYSQQQWGKEYQRLDHLRLNERQLSTSSEWIKNDIARKNDPKSHGLVPRTRDSIVVIPPAPIRPPLPMRTPGSDTMQKNITPVGY